MNELEISFTGLDGLDRETSHLVNDLASAKRIVTDMEERGAQFISASFCHAGEEVAIYEAGAWTEFHDLV